MFRDVDPRGVPGLEVLKEAPRDSSGNRLRLSRVAVSAASGRHELEPAARTSRPARFGWTGVVGFVRSRWDPGEMESVGRVLFLLFGLQDFRFHSLYDTLME